MTESRKQCAWKDCCKTFRPRARSGRHQTVARRQHEGAVYCSDACRQAAYRLRRSMGLSARATTVTKVRLATRVRTTVTSPKISQSFQAAVPPKIDPPRPEIPLPAEH